MVCEDGGILQDVVQKLCQDFSRLLIERHGHSLTPGFPGKPPDVGFGDAAAGLFEGLLLGTTVNCGGITAATSSLCLPRPQFPRRRKCRGASTPAAWPWRRGSRRCGCPCRNGLRRGLRGGRRLWREEREGGKASTKLFEIQRPLLGSEGRRWWPRSKGCSAASAAAGGAGTPAARRGLHFGSHLGCGSSISPRRAGATEQGLARCRPRCDPNDSRRHSCVLSGVAWRGAM
mmetsp:Transcript_110658/g.357034  ORF Transcript_110658/g.357034 Transcript_110658/m.357034 type:complete len:231 (+) Transcript_110658:668-1360(+)